MFRNLRPAPLTSGRRFLAIFLPPYQAAVSAILVNVGGYIFKAKGNTELDPGYTVLYPKKTKKADGLPVCQKGDRANLVKTNVTKGTTKPPDRYNPDTILSAMKNAGQDLPDRAMRSALREAEGLGTPATRDSASCRNNEGPKEMEGFVLHHRRRGIQAQRS